MDAFGWSTQYAAERCLLSRPSDDEGLLSAFMCTSFRDGLHHSDYGGLDMSSSQTIPNLVHCHDGTSLPDSVPAAFMGLDTAADMLPSGTGAVDDDLFDAFAYVPNVAEGAARDAASNSNTVFSSYNSTTAGNGGNISFGESNTCSGGQDIEVASPCAAVSRPTLLHETQTLPPSKRKLDKYPALCASAKTAVAKRAAVSSSSSSTTSITFGGQRHHHQAPGRTTLLGTSGHEPDAEAMAQVKEMIYRAAAMRPVHQLLRAAEPPSHQNKPRRKNVRISSDPQTVAARLRRERVSERLRVLQRLVPGGSRMDTASMLDEAASYLKFLKSQFGALESAGGNPSNGSGGYCNGGSLQQNYYFMCNSLGGGTSGRSAVLAFGSRDGIGAHVKPNRTTPL